MAFGANLACSSSILKRHEFDSFRFTPRDSCSAGARHFTIMSSGMIARCQAYWYDSPHRFFGNVMDEQVRSTIRENKSNYFPCELGYCFGQCDGAYTVQKIVKQSIHTGSRLNELGIANRDFVVLQLHLNSVCNLACQYCCARQWMDQLHGRDMDSASWIDTMQFFISLYDVGHVVVMGGEPTLSACFHEFMCLVLSSGWSIDLVTNFTKPQKIFDAVSDLPDKSKLSIGISAHPTNPAFDFDDLLAWVSKLKKLKIDFYATLVDVETNREHNSKLDILNKLHQAGARYTAWIPPI